MDGTWSKADAVAVFGPEVAAGLMPFPDDDDVLGDDLHREVLLRCLAPQLGAASDAGVLDPCRVEAYVRASVGHRAAVVAAGVALTLADAPLLPVAVLDATLPELFDDLARAHDDGLLVAADVAPAQVVGSPGVDGPAAVPEEPAACPETRGGGPANTSLPEAPAVPPGIDAGRPANAPLSGAPAVPPRAGQPSDLPGVPGPPDAPGAHRRHRGRSPPPSGRAVDVTSPASRGWSCYRTDHT